jgi:glutaredoxin 3
MTHPNIKIFSTQFCGYCTAAERLFKNKGFEYVVIKVDEDPAMFEQMLELTGRRSVPQIFIGDFHVGGWDDLSALNMSGELDDLLQTSA